MTQLTERSQWPVVDTVRKLPLAEQVYRYEVWDEVALQFAKLHAAYRHYLIGQGITDIKTQRLLLAEYARLLTEHALVPDPNDVGLRGAKEQPR